MILFVLWLHLGAPGCFLRAFAFFRVFLMSAGGFARSVGVCESFFSGLISNRFVFSSLLGVWVSLGAFWWLLGASGCFGVFIGVWACFSRARCVISESHGLMSDSCLYCFGCFWVLFRAVGVLAYL